MPLGLSSRTLSYVGWATAEMGLHDSCPRSSRHITGNSISSDHGERLSESRIQVRAGRRDLQHRGCSRLTLSGKLPIYPSNCLGATSMTHRSVLSRRRVLHGYRPRHSYRYCVVAHHAGTVSAPSVLQVVRLGPSTPLNILNRELNRLLPAESIARLAASLVVNFAPPSKGSSRALFKSH